jgi:hypothetical protein
VGEAYKEADDGEWITPTQTGHRMRCCDCGLVHRVDFRVLEPSGDHPKGAIQYRAHRDNRATAQVKRHLNRKASR